MILHMCSADEWAAVPEGGSYRAASLETEGFIHCSDPGTVHQPANRLYPGRTDLVLLEVDPARLGVPLRWEQAYPDNRDATWFPHVYGPIPRAAVLAAHPFPPEPDGSFRLPGVLANR